MFGACTRTLNYNSAATRQRQRQYENNDNETVWATCYGDLNGNGTVGIEDLIEFFASMEPRATEKYKPTPSPHEEVSSFLASLLLTSVGWGQTGTGVVLLTEESHLHPTIVDSTSVFNFQLQNTVGVSQTIYFGGLDAPFQLSVLPIELDSWALQT